MLSTINNAGRMLDLFDVGQPEHGVTEVALALDMSKSTAHAMLASLTKAGLLRRTERGRYRLGWRLLSLNRVLVETTDFRVHARPAMEMLGSRHGGVVALATLDHGDVVYVDRLAAGDAGLPLSEIGSAQPAHRGAVGKALLANLPRAELDGLIEGGAGRVADPISLRRELDLIRERGFAIERSEAAPGGPCAAAPIFATGRRVVAAIGLSFSSTHEGDRAEWCSRTVVAAAGHVTRRLRAAEHSRESLRELQSAV